jgi:hypothetical protein
MSVDGGGEAELVEAALTLAAASAAAGAAGDRPAVGRVEVARDNPKLGRLLAAVRGRPGRHEWDQQRLAQDLLVAIWSVLSTNR